ncbi:AAA family ATPase [Salipiger pacificus]|nr:AAA family ATPase [Alloyangia pacifica]
MIQVRTIRLRSYTADKTFGVDADFGPGLNVFRADNSSGKSTLMQSLLYALGFERSLGTSLEVPLPFAMREQIREEVHGDLLTVMSSFVSVTLEDQGGNEFSIRRDVVGGADRRLVRTWDGGLDDEQSSTNRKDFFLHDGGSAKNEAGFHNFLARKLGWELPSVARFDGSETPLYMETLFPLFFVEQKRGWSVVQGPFPTVFRIQDLNRRVMEFVLDLDVGRKRRRLTELRRKRSALEREWKAKRASFLEARSSTFKVEGIPLDPTAEFAKEGDFTLHVFYDSEWVPLDRAQEELSESIRELEKKEFSAVEDDVEYLKDRLASKEEELLEAMAGLAVATNDYNVAISERNSLARRISTLNEDLSQNRDTLKLRNFGSVLGESVSSGSCPTCHQNLEHELLPDASSAAMGLEENIVFIRSQLKLYSSLQANVEADLTDAVTRLKSIRELVSSLRAAVRSAKADLVRPNSSFTRADLEAIVRLRGKGDIWKEHEEKLREEMDGLKSLAKTWVGVKNEISKLGNAELSMADKKKLKALQSSTQSLLEEFNFRTFTPEEITISETDFRPQVLRTDQDGELVEREIGFEVSASDGIRLKWAYYFSILTVCRDLGGNHIGFLVFDEPGQQQMKDVDLSNMLEWAAKNVSSAMQVNITTSDDRTRVRNALEGTQAKLREFDDYILKVIA